MSDRALGTDYSEFLVDRVLPFVQSTLPVAADRASTGVMGSSLGGLISLYLYLNWPDTFGFVGSMSTAAWFTPEFWSFIESVDLPPGRVYLDVGTQEDPGNEAVTEAYLETHRRLAARFASAAGELLFVEDPGGVHHESAWARRLPAALEFLLTGRPV